VPRILVVEDEEHLAAGIRFNLELDGYEVETIGDGLRALERLAPASDGPLPPAPVDLVLLDVMLPGLDGFQIVERMRQAGNFAPVLMLTAKGLPEDSVHGLEAGADDYLAKPFELPELLARVEAMLRRRQRERKSEPKVTVGRIEIDVGGRTVKVGGKPVALTQKEFDLLCLLARWPGQVFSREEILDQVWGFGFDGTARTVDNFILGLRHKLEPDPSRPRHIKTVRQVGYRLDP